MYALLFVQPSQIHLELMPKLHDVHQMIVVVVDSPSAKMAMSTFAHEHIH